LNDGLIDEDPEFGFSLRALEKQAKSSSSIKNSWLTADKAAGESRCIPQKLRSYVICPEKWRNC
jgi:hypothetical protein